MFQLPTSWHKAAECMNARVAQVSEVGTEVPPAQMCGSVEVGPPPGGNVWWMCCVEEEGVANKPQPQQVNQVGSMVEVGGKIKEINDIDNEVPQEVPQVGATGVLGATGFEAGRVDAQEEGKFVKRLIDPRLPTEEEVAHHELTHLPYRNWCPVCVKAMGRDLDHRGQYTKRRNCQNIVLIVVSPGMNLGTNLRFW